MIRFGLLTLICAFAVYAGLFVIYAVLPRGGRADMAVVFGSEVLKDGQPSKRLVARLDAAARAYDQGLAPLILVSGAKGASGFDEASVMRDYLFLAGIPETAILVDSAGTNTLATARNAMRTMRRLHLHRVLVVTQYFHVPRCMLAFHRVGVESVAATYPVFVEGRDLYSLARELVAFPDYALFDWPRD